MSRRNAVWVVVLSNVGLVAIWFVMAGGLAGIARDPVVELAFLALLAVVSVPVSWITYHRALSSPPATAPAGPASPEKIAEVGLDAAPVALVADRRKLLAWALCQAAVIAVLVAISLQQPGVCRTGGLTASLAVFAPSLIWFACCLLVRPTLNLSRAGLALTTPWRSQHWGWDEIRDIQVAKVRIPFVGYLENGPTRGVAFKRFQPPGGRAGAAQAGIWSIWPISGVELAAVLDEARLRWSTPAGGDYTAIPMTWRAYVPGLLRMAAILGVLWLWYGQPCR